jgi:hypothetical protein
LKAPCGKAFTVYRYMSLSARKAFSLERSVASPVRRSADFPERRSDTPKGLSGQTRLFTAGT